MYCASTSIQMQKNSDVLLFNATPPLIREEHFTEQTLLNSEG
jgi:hypothetical protein